MASEERTWLLAHLRDQAATLASMADTAVGSAGSEHDLIAFRDQVFVIKETLLTLDVPGTLLSRDEWSDARPEAEVEESERRRV